MIVIAVTATLSGICMYFVRELLLPSIGFVGSDGSHWSKRMADLLESAPWRHGVGDQRHDDLAIAISLAKDNSGSNVIDHGGSFQVVFTNRSAKPIRLWSDKCQVGHEALAFRIADSNGRTWAIYRPPVNPPAWNEPLAMTETIPPRGTISRAIEPSGDVRGQPEWKGVPEPNTGAQFQLEAIFEIKSTDAAGVYGVWIGRVSSKSVETLFVNSRLRSPHEYLSAHCPEQALRVMQADPTWVAKYESQCTPLHRAVEIGYIKVVRWLLEHGADVDATSHNNGATPLHLATDPAIVAELLRYKPKLNRRGGGWSKTALQENADMFSRWADEADKQQAAIYKRITEMLRNAGAYYDIHSAIYLNDVVRVREIFKADPAMVNELDRAQISPLRQAARLGHAEICKLLIDCNADKNDRGQQLGFPVLSDALEHPAVVKVLLDAGAIADVRLDPRGGMSHFIVGGNGTLLHYAAGEGAVESVRLLLERNLSINAVADSGLTPLHVAAQCRDAEMVRFLLGRGADGGAKDKGGRTPLDLAEHFGNKGAAEALRAWKGRK